MVVRLDRSRRAGAHLEWKVRIFLVGAVLGLSGILLEERWLSGAAIAVLAAGALVRFLPGGRDLTDDGEDEEEDGPPSASV